MNIVQVNEHEGFQVIKSDSGDWFYTKEAIELGRYDLEMKHVEGRWWVTKATPERPVDYKQLMKDFRKKVKENNHVERRY